MNQDDFLSVEWSFNSRWLEVSAHRYRAGDGVADYYIVKRDPFVLILASDSDGRIILVQQYRPAMRELYLGLPAGYVNPGEGPLEAAERELREEAGIRGENFNLIGELHPLPGYINSPAFIVRCDAPSPERSLQTNDPDEIAGVVRMARSEVLAKVLSGEIKEMQAVSALLLEHSLALGAG